MAQEQRQKLLSAFKDWLLYEAGVTQAIDSTKKEIMIEFSRYQTAIDETLAGILKACLEEKQTVANLLQAMAAQDKEQVDSAIAELAGKQQQIVDAITGIISTTPSPTTPTPIPSVPSGSTPPLVIPEISPTVAPLIPSEDPQVPVTVEPSPIGVGVDGGSNIAAA